MNRITKLFQQKGDKTILSIYFTAGYPALEDTLTIAETLQEAGVDFLEIGFPYSDPVADGPAIQHSSQVALQNGMDLKTLFRQLEDLRKTVHIPVLLMGYVNPVLQFGVKAFLEACKRVGVDGVIIPDLPADEYEQLYAPEFQAQGIRNIFLVTPQSSPERIQKMDALSEGFIYLLSSSSTTGGHLALDEQSSSYFKRIRAMQLKNPQVIGFGISDKASFEYANQYADGAIVGSAFIRELQAGFNPTRVRQFIQDLRGNL